MKVLHVLGELKPSGAEVMLYSAGYLLAKYGLDAEILATGTEAGPFAKQLVEAGYTIRHIPFTKSPRFFFVLYQLLRLNQYDVVHLHTERANFWLGLLALMSAKRCIRSIHNNFTFSGYLGWKRKWQRQLLNRLGLIHVAICKSVHDTEQKFFGLDAPIIYNWYDSRRFQTTTPDQRREARKKLDLPADRFILVSVGNCSPVKNHAALIEAMSQNKQKNLFYLHIGIEKDCSERDLVKQLEIADCIRYCGMQANVLPFLQAADLFVMPSLYEGFSIAAIEAIATGLPALLSDTPGLLECRTLFEGLHYCKPDARSLADALDKICATPSELLRQKCSANGETAERLLGIERGLSAYLDLYRDGQRL